MYLQNKLEVNGMLLQFKFSNYRCFADETVFNMAAAPIKDHKDSLLEENETGVYILPVSALYGANASGKSSFFMAFSRMQTIIVDRFMSDSANITSNESIFTTPYLFTGDPKNISEALSKPSMFETTFSIDSFAYRYGFECTQNKIISEWLYKQKISKNPTVEKLIFRVGIASNDIVFGNINQKVKSQIEYSYSMETHAPLLLTDVGTRKNNDSELKLIYNWFKNATVLLTQDQEIMTSYAYEQFVGESIYNNFSFLHFGKDNAKEGLLSIIKEIDPCISNIEVIKEIDENGKAKFSLKAVHQLNNYPYKISFKAESEGTKKDLFISVLLLGSLAIGAPLFIDELDAKLHPLLLRKIVQMYKNKKINTQNAQLIFSAHNIINMDSSDLRRDEIWFVEKNNQKSTMYSLYDFDDEDGTVRSDLDFGKHYLSGRFGAIPFQD